MSKNVLCLIVMTALLFLFSCQAGIDTGLPEQSKMTIDQEISKSVIKTVSISKNVEYYAPGDDGYNITKYVNIPSSYYYDDKQFSGTIPCVNYYVTSRVPYYSVFKYTVAIVYQGPVTLYPETKNVYAYTRTSFVAFSGEENNIPGNVYIPPTYNYNQGYYHGTLNIINYYVVSTNLVYYPYYEYTVEFQYYGQVTCN